MILFKYHKRSSVELLNDDDDDNRIVVFNMANNNRSNIYISSVFFSAFFLLFSLISFDFVLFRCFVLLARLQSIAFTICFRFENEQHNRLGTISSIQHLN